MANQTLANAPTYCNIELDNHNNSLFGPFLAACNSLNGQRSAQALIVGFGSATLWICLELISQLLFRFKVWKTLYFGYVV
jgi:hypothetical protein